MNAIILAGGFGSRLKPLTNLTPKPMLSVANRPIIDYSIAQLYHYGIRDFVFTLGFLPQKIIEWAIGYAGVSTHFYVEDTPLGTLGGVKAASAYLDNVFIVLSGDGISDINLNAMLKRHLASKAEITIAVKRVDSPSLYGVADLGDDGFIKGFVEKPHNITSPSYINCGVYIINKSALNYTGLTSCDFAKDLFPLLVSGKKLAYYIHQGYWQDVGDFTSFYNANFDMLKAPFFTPVKNFNDNEYSSRLLGGEYASLASNSATIAGTITESVIGHNSRVLDGAVLNRCVVLDNVNISGRHFGCIIGDGVCIDIYDRVNNNGLTAQNTELRV